MHNYAEFSHAIFSNQVFPILADLSMDIDSQPLRKPQAYYCSPDARGATGTRLYPSSLTILAFKCIDPQSEITEDLLKIAAAIELFHNHSLTHDDVLDGHQIRRNRETLVASGGAALSLLAGNHMIGDALQLIALSCNPQIPLLIEYLGKRICDLNIGQIMDERSTWDTIEPSGLFAHWWKTSALKLAVGIYAVEAAAIVHNRIELIQCWHDFEMALSLISQIMNDTGDLFRFAGFYRTEHSNRPKFQEGELKFTYPVLWLADRCGIAPVEIAANPDFLQEKLKEFPYMDHAVAEIERLRSEAKALIMQMNLPISDYLSILIDYTNAPRIPNIM